MHVGFASIARFLLPKLTFEGVQRGSVGLHLWDVSVAKIITRDTLVVSTTRPQTHFVPKAIE